MEEVKIDIHDPESLAAIVAEAKAKGLVKGGESSMRAAITRKGVATGLGDGAAAGVPAGVCSKWVEVDAAQAEYWLKNNFRNRPIRWHTVAGYARDMAQGRWVRTHQGIAFNDNDDLIDGQHRLHGIIEADKLMPGIKVAMMVTYGLPSKIEAHEMTTMDAVDRGATRSVADQLKIQHGMKHGSQIAMIAKSLAVLCVPDRLKKLSVGETLEIYRAFQAAVDKVIELRPKGCVIKSAGVLAAFAFAMTARAEVETAFRSMLSGYLSEGTALGALRAFLISPASALLMRSSDRALATLVLAAIEADESAKAVPDIAALLDSQIGVQRYRGLIPAIVGRVAGLFGTEGRA